MSGELVYALAGAENVHLATAQDTRSIKEYRLLIAPLFPVKAADLARISSRNHNN